MARRKREPKKKLLSSGNLMAVFIVLIMTTSILGFMYGGGNGGETSFTYGTHEFSSLVDGTFAMLTDGEPIVFNYHPDVVLLDDNYNISDSFFESLKAYKNLYVTYAPDDTYKDAIAVILYDVNPRFNLKGILSSRFNINLINAFTAENEFGLPIIDCENAGSGEIVIEFKDSETPGFTQSDNCVIVNVGSDRDIIMLRDRLLYGLYGVSYE